MKRKFSLLRAMKRKFSLLRALIVQSLSEGILRSNNGEFLYNVRFSGLNQNPCTRFPLPRSNRVRLYKIIIPINMRSLPRSRR